MDDIIESLILVIFTFHSIPPIFICPPPCSAYELSQELNSTFRGFSEAKVRWKFGDLESHFLKISSLTFSEGKLYSWKILKAILDSDTSIPSVGKHLQ